MLMTLMEIHYSDLDIGYPDTTRSEYLSMTKHATKKSEIGKIRLII